MLPSSSLLTPLDDYRPPIKTWVPSDVTQPHVQLELGLVMSAIGRQLDAYLVHPI